MQDKTTLAFVDGNDNSLRKTVSVPWRTALGMSSDATHVYLLYEVNPDETNQTRAGILVFDWNGRLLNDVVLNNVFPYTSATNVQGLISHDNYAELLVCNWGSQGMYAVQINFDYRVLGY